MRKTSSRYFSLRPNLAACFPTLSVWPRLKKSELPDRDDLAGVYILALSSEARELSGTSGLPIFWELCVAMGCYCLSGGIRELIGMATPRTARIYRRFGWPIEIIGEEAVHWGEMCVPFRVLIADAEAEVSRKGATGSAVSQKIIGLIETA